MNVHVKLLYIYIYTYHQLRACFIDIGFIIVYLVCVFKIKNWQLIFG